MGFAFHPEIQVQNYLLCGMCAVLQADAALYCIDPIYHGAMEGFKGSSFKEC